MIKLMDILLEDDKKVKKPPTRKAQPKKPAASTPKPAATPAANHKKDKDNIAASADRIANRFTQRPPDINYTPNNKIPPLSQLAKGVSPEPAPQQQGDPALAGLPQAPDEEPEEYPFGQPQLKEPTPSLSQLAKDVFDDEEDGEKKEPEKEKEKEDPLKDLPKFNDADSEDWNQNPFGDPYAGQDMDYRTGLQKGVDAIGQGIKKGWNSLKANPMTPPEQAVQQEPGQAPQAWQPGAQEPPSEPPQSEPPMPKLKSLSGKEAGRGLGGKHWKWKPGQKVDIGFIKGLTVLGVDQFGAKLQAKNGGIYRFIPHRGLRKIG